MAKDNRCVAAWLSPGADPGNESRGAGHHRRGRVARALTGPANGSPAAGGDGAVCGRAFVCRAGRGSPAAVHPDEAQRGGSGPGVPAPRWHPAGPGVGCGTGPRAHRGPGGRAARSPVSPADRGEPNGLAAPADSPGYGGLELPAPQPGRAAPVHAAGGVCRGLHPRGRQGALCGGDIASEEVLDLLLRLVGKSLVGTEDRGDGSTRYRLLETLRQYAQEQLVACGEAAAYRAQHAAHFVALAEEAEPLLHGPDQLRWMERLAREQDNLRAALAWSLEAATEGTADLGLRLAGALWWFWFLHEGDRGEGQLWLEQVLAAGGGTPAARAKALVGPGISRGRPRLRRGHGSRSWRRAPCSAGPGRTGAFSPMP
jgi:hypothetical protein